MKDKRLFGKRLLYKDIKAFAEVWGVVTDKVKGKYLVWQRTDCGMVSECSTLPELLEEVYSFSKLPN